MALKKFEENFGRTSPCDGMKNESTKKIDMLTQRMFYYIFHYFKWKNKWQKGRKWGGIIGFEKEIGLLGKRKGWEINIILAAVPYWRKA